MNPAGFHFSALDSAFARVLLPLKRRLEARGERLFVNLNYTAFLDQCPPPVYVHGQSAEYAEFVLAAFLHLRYTFGFVPDAVEMILEPDNVTAWRSGTLIGPAIVAAAARLATAGFSPVFVAPSTSDLGRAIAYLDLPCAGRPALAARAGVSVMLVSPAGISMLWPSGPRQPVLSRPCSSTSEATSRISTRTYGGAVTKRVSNTLSHSPRVITVHNTFGSSMAARW